MIVNCLVGIKDILDAFNGESAGLVERGVYLGGPTPVCHPGKSIAGKAIYSSDGKDGGSVIFKTKTCVLIVLYDQAPNTAVRVAQETAEYMEECGR